MKLTAWEQYPYSIRKAWRVMRITTLLILVISLHLSAKTTAQKITLSSNNISIEQFFNQLEKQTGYSFLLENGVVSKDEKISVNVKDELLETVLDHILKPISLSYKIENKTVYILKAIKPFASDGNHSLSDSLPHAIIIHGKVTDSLGNPLSGASVTIKGSKTGTQTDANGNFRLEALDNKATLIISYTGYQSAQIKADDRKEIMVKLLARVELMEDVVINKGYYSIRQQLNTGNVSIVKGEDIQKQPVSDPLLALEGRVPGLYIQQTSGVPGSYSTVEIRGRNSIANGNNPFYIVDGVPFNSTSLTSIDVGGGVVGSPYNGQQFGLSPFNNLNPSDIESVEVLKDADATAIYGSRGANGVILITTKKGKAGHTLFDINVSQGFGDVGHEMKMLHTADYLTMRHEALANDGMAADPTIDYDLTFWDTTRYTDWQKVLIGNTAKYTNAQVSLSGGTANTQFILGGGYTGQTTVFPGDYQDKKASAHFNLTHSSTDQKLHLVFSTSYVNDQSDLPAGDFTYGINLAPDAPPLYTTDGKINWATIGGSATWSNPVAVTANHDLAVSDNLISNLNLSYQIVRGLQVRLGLGYTHSELSQTNLTPSISQSPPYNDAESRSNSFGGSDFRTWISELQINYHKKIGKGDLDALIGTTFQNSSQYTSGQQAYGFANDILITNPQAASAIYFNGASSTTYRYNALFGRLSYNWQEKYVLNFTARRDGSSRFGPGRQFGNFGAIGAGWIFSNEKWFTDRKSTFSFGKLRASYGTTGNDQITDYQYLATYSSSYQSYQGLSGLYPTRIANPDFGWELVRKTEGGLELGFLNNRIFFTASYYVNRTGNQLVGFRLPVLTGFSSIQANLPAVVENKGLELELTTVNIKHKDFSWSSSINISFPQNKLVSYPNIKNSNYANEYVVGQSLFVRKVFQSLGVDPQTGLYTFNTKNGNGIPTYPDDLITSKPISQQYFGGFLNTFRYKGFSLDIFFQFVKQNGYLYSTYMPGEENLNQPQQVMNRWQKPGDISNVQKFSTGNGDQTPAEAYSAYTNPSDAVIGDASFIRLKNLSLSYQISAPWVRKAHLQSVRLYLQGQNLLTITNYFGLDPETGSSGLPPLRMITGGFQVSL